MVNKPKAAAYRAPGAQGGAVQGIGWALNEEYVFNTKGAMLNASFLDYRMPTSLDLPMIDTVLVEVTNPGTLSACAVLVKCRSSRPWPRSRTPSIARPVCACGSCR